MYGYHPEEDFAIEVGRAVAKATPAKNARVVEYDDAPDVPCRVNSLYQKPRFPKFWRFVRRQGMPEYLVELHSGGVVKRDTKLAAYIHLKTRAATIDSILMQRLDDYVTTRPYPVTAFYVPNNHYMPIGVTKIVVELLPPAITIHKGVEFVKGLLGVLF